MQPWQQRQQTATIASLEARIAALERGSQTTTTAATTTLDSGTYTPTLFNVTNVASSAAAQCQYLRVGRVVTVSGYVSVDPTSAVATQLDVSLPIASNLSAIENCCGVGVNAEATPQVIAIFGDATNNRATFFWTATSTANRVIYFTFTYLVV